MAALDTPWLSMSAPRSSLFRPDPSDRYGSPNPSSSSIGGDRDGVSGGGGGGGAGAGAGDSYLTPKPTYATFSPVASLSGGTTASSAAKRRSIILVHQKSPLLLATPPQITRSLAYSHPYILPLNKLAGLLSWTTGDPWESFLVVIAWWIFVMYADTMVRLAGPVFLVLTLIAGMYGRRYSPLSTSGWSNEDGSAGTAGVGSSSAGSKSASSGGSGGGSSGSGSSGGGLGYFLFGIGGGSTSNNSGSSSARDAASAKAKNQSLDSAGASSVLSGKGGGGGGSASHDTPGGTGLGHQRSASELITNTRHQKTLDEIVETLREFTARCNLLLEPLLELTDFLSTQSTPISATTRPALTVLFVRILLCTPFWFLLTLPPLRLITSRRVALVFGTLILTWHSRVMRVSRTILWRSATIRRAAALVTGLEFEGPMKSSKTPSYVTAGRSNLSDPTTTAATAAAALQSKLSSTKPGRRLSSSRESELTKAIRRARAGNDTGVRFTFILYENQRRWVGLGWTTSLFAYERPAWTDEHNNAVPSKDEFELPEVEDGSKMRWRWVGGGRWRVDGVMDEAVRVEKTGPHGEHKDTWDYDGDGGRMGWVYYDNKWQNGRRGQDGWTRWTRRRKWYRDAELVEVDDEDEGVPPSNDNKDGGGEANNGAGDAGESTPTAESPSSPRTEGQSPGASSSSSSSTVGVSIDKAKAGYEKGTPGVDGSLPDGASFSADGSNDGASDAASILSTSSRSTRLKAPSLRRRVTDASIRGMVAPAVTTAAVAMAMPTTSGISSGHGGSSAAWGIKSHRRRGSEEQEEEAAMLSSSVGVRLDDGGDAGGWGYGDEARMGLD